MFPNDRGQSSPSGSQITWVEIWTCCLIRSNATQIWELKAAGNVYGMLREVPGTGPRMGDRSGEDRGRAGPPPARSPTWWLTGLSRRAVCWAPAIQADLVWRLNPPGPDSWPSEMNSFKNVPWAASVVAQLWLQHLGGWNMKTAVSSRPAWESQLVQACWSYGKTFKNEWTNE